MRKFLILIMALLGLACGAPAQTPPGAYTSPVLAGGSSAVGPVGTLQCTNGVGVLTACGAVDNGTLLNINRDTAFLGPNPYVDVRSKGIRNVNAQVAPQVPGVTATCVNGSNQVIINTISTFQNGDPVLLLGCGAPQSMTTPTITSVTPVVSKVMTGVGDDAVGPTGSTSYGPYQIIWCDFAGGCTAPSAGFSITNGQPTLGEQSVTITSETRVGQTVTATLASAHELPVGCSNPICPMITTDGTSDGTFLGQWHAATVPDTTHVTYIGGLSAATGYGASSSSTGGNMRWYNENKVLFPTEAGGFQAFCYNNGTFMWAALPLNPTSSEMLDGSLYCDDYGSSMMASVSNRPIWVPNSVPAAATSDALSTTIVSGAGTTTLTLANAAGTSVAGTTIVYDSAQLIKAAAVAAGGQSIYIPPNVETVINSNIDLSATNASIVGGNNMFMHAAIVLGGIDQWSGTTFPWVGSQGSFEYQSNPQLYCYVTPCLFGVNNTANQISNLQFNPQSNGLTMVLMDGGGGSPHGRFSNVYLGAASSDYLSVSLWLRGASDHSSSGGAKLYGVNILGAQDGVGHGVTPVLYADNGSIDASYLFFNGHGALARTDPSGGNGVYVDNVYIQGGFMPVFTVSGLEDGTGNEGQTYIQRYDMDTTSSNLVNYIQSGGGCLCLASVALGGSGPDSGYTIFGGQPFYSISGSESGQNTAATGGADFIDGLVQLHGVGQFLVPIINSIAPTGVVSSGGSVPVGAHTYSIAIEDANGNYSGLSPTVSETTTTGNQTVTLTPPAAPLGAQGWYPYRDGQFYPGGCGSPVPISFSSNFVDSFSTTCDGNPSNNFGAASSSLSYKGVITNSMIDSGMTPGSAPICAAGTGGAFTNIGCTGGGSATPGGSSTDVQFNSSGSFGGDSGFVYGSGAATLSHSLVVGSGNSTDHVQIESQGATHPSSGALRLDNSGSINWENSGGSGVNTLSMNTNTLLSSVQFSSPHILTNTACASSASPAVCGAAASGFVVIAASATSVVVDTTAVTANSQIFVQEDDSLGTALSVTCNTGILTSPPEVTARVAATSFTITTSSAPATNPACYSYWLVN